MQCFNFLSNSKMEPKTCYFPLEKLRSIQMLNVTLNSGKKTISKQNNVSCHHKTVPKPKPLACLLFSECSLVLFTICISKPVGSRFGQVKFRTGKFSPGIAFTISTNQFHSQKNGFESLKLVLKMALKKCNTNFR